MTTTTTEAARINWAARQATARIPFQVVDGLPINPVQPDLPPGQGKLNHYGERACADVAVLVAVAGRRRLLLGRRDDGHGWAIPGGGLEDGETDLAGGLRELAEETGLRIDVDDPQVTISVGAPRYVPDPRARLHAWMVTTLIVVDLGSRPRLPHAVAGDDLLEVAWLRARSLQSLERGVRRRDPAGRLFSAHLGMLGSLLG